MGGVVEIFFLIFLVVSVVVCCGRQKERISAGNGRRLDNSSNTARNERRINNSSNTARNERRINNSSNDVDLNVLLFEATTYLTKAVSILQFLRNPSEVPFEERLQRVHSLGKRVPERRNRRKSEKSNGGRREENHVSSGNEGRRKLNNPSCGGIEEVSIYQNPVSSTEMARESNGTNVPDPDQQRRRSDGTKVADDQIVAVKRPDRPVLSTEIAKGGRREENHVSSGNEGRRKLNNPPCGGIEEVSIYQNPVSSTEMARESNGTNVPDPDQQRRRSDGTKVADGQIVAVKCPDRPVISTEIAKGSNGTNAVEGSCEDPPVPDQQRRSDGTNDLGASCEVAAERPVQVHKHSKASRKAVQVHKHSKASRKGEIKSEGQAGWGIVQLLRNPYGQSTEKAVQFSEALWKRIAKYKSRRQSGKSNGGLERKENHVSSGNVGRLELNDLPHGGNEELASGEPPISRTKIAKDSFEGHPVPVRVYLVESDQDPVYLAPGIRTCRLYDLIQELSDDAALLSIDSVNGLMRDLIVELGCWHDKGRIHRDLKPQNVLITEVSAKLPDIGTIHGDASYHPTDPENSGWRACEQLLGESPSRATNMFSVGCAWFMLLSGGKHPFGDHPQERDNNIWEDNMNLSLLKLTPDAKYIFWRMLNGDPKLRPETWEVRSYFWSPEKKLRFYAWFSDILLSNSALARDLLNELENEGPVFNGEWINLIDPIFKGGIERRNIKYDYTSVKDLVRYMRNLFSHPAGIKEIKEIRRWDDKRIYSYFADIFPSLWLKSYRAASRFCGEEDWFKGFHREEPFLGGAH